MSRQWEVRSRRGVHWPPHDAGQPPRVRGSRIITRAEIEAELARGIDKVRAVLGHVLSA